MHPFAAVEHSYNCMVLLCRALFGVSGRYTKITDIYRTQASNVTLTKRGNIVHASFSGQNISSNGAAGLIPEGYRPNSQHRFLSISFHSGGINNGIACVTVDNNGTVSCKNTSNVSANALLWSSTMWLI